jgi:hypothetical protein
VLIGETENENCQEEMQSEFRKNRKGGMLMVAFGEQMFPCEVLEKAN